MKNLAIFLLFIIVSSSISVELRKYQTLLRGADVDPCKGKESNCPSGECIMNENACVKARKRTKTDCDNKSEADCQAPNCKFEDNKCVSKVSTESANSKKRIDDAECENRGANCTSDNQCVLDGNVCKKNTNPVLSKKDDVCAEKSKTDCPSETCNFTDTDGCKLKPQPQSQSSDRKKREVTCSNYNGNQTDCESNNCNYTGSECVAKVPTESANSKKRIDDAECNKRTNCTSDSQCVLDGDVCKKNTNPVLSKKDDVCTGKSKTDCPAETCKYIVEENVEKCVVN